MIHLTAELTRKNLPTIRRSNLIRGFTLTKFWFHSTGFVAVAASFREDAARKQTALMVWACAHHQDLASLTESTQIPSKRAGILS